MALQWLPVLQIFYTALDHVVPQVVQTAMKGTGNWLAETTHRFADTLIIGVVMVVILAVGDSGGEIFTLQTYVSHFLKSPHWAMKLLVQRMCCMRRAFATLEEALRTMVEERKHFHLGMNSSLIQEQAHCSMENERISFHFDEGELENGAAGPKGLSDDEIMAILLYPSLPVMRRQVLNEPDTKTAHSLAWALTLLAS